MAECLIQTEKSCAEIINSGGDSVTVGELRHMEPRDSSLHVIFWNVWDSYLYVFDDDDDMLMIGEFLYIWYFGMYKSYDHVYDDDVVDVDDEDGMCLSWMLMVTMMMMIWIWKMTMVGDEQVIFCVTGFGGTYIAWYYLGCVYMCCSINIMK